MARIQSLNASRDGGGRIIKDKYSDVRPIEHVSTAPLPSGWLYFFYQESPSKDRHTGYLFEMQSQKDLNHIKTK